MRQKTESNDLRKYGSYLAAQSYLRGSGSIQDMKRTVKEHLDWLNSRLNALNTAFMTTKDKNAANNVETEIRMVKLAIGHYETAIAIEQSLSQHFPDSAPAPKS